jgi:hypothetical protein
MKQRLKKALIWFPILLIVSVFSLELYTSNCNCIVIEEERANLTVPICEKNEDAYPFTYESDQIQLINERVFWNSRG